MTSAVSTCQADLSEADLNLLFNKVLLHATDHVNRLRWRGSFVGLLPDGYDPNSLTAQAFTDLLQSRPTHHPPRTASRITRQASRITHHASRITSPTPHPSTLDELEPLLRRFIHRHIDRLHRRQENFLLRNASDLPLVPVKEDTRHHNSDTEEVEFVHPIETLPDPNPSPAETLLRREADADLLQLKTRFLAFLGPQRRLKTLFRYLCAGVSQPKTLARKLRLPVSAINNLKKRLQAQIQAFRQAPNRGRNSSAPPKNC